MQLKIIFFIMLVSLPGVRADLSCLDIGKNYEHIVSTGLIKVPPTVEAENGYRSLEALKTINKQFSFKQVDHLIADPLFDLPSKLRLITEFKCFESWRQQHDFYLKILKENKCGYLRYKAVELLIHDVCNANTLTALINEFEKTLYPQIQEQILKAIALKPNDGRVKKIFKEIELSKSKNLKKIAKNAQAFAANQSCIVKDGNDKPNYGTIDVANVCEKIEDDETELLNKSESRADSENGLNDDVSLKAGKIAPAGANKVNF